MNMEADCEVNIILLGESEVGKTSLLQRFVHGKFKDRLPKTIINKYEKVIEIGNILVKLILWDTAGRETYYNLIKRYYEIADGALFVYNIQNVNTFSALSKWLDDFKTVNKDALISIVGNKTEDETKRAVNLDEVERFVRTRNLEFLEVSAKSNKNVNIVFHHLLQKIFVSKNVLPFSKDKCAVKESEKLKIDSSSCLFSLETQRTVNNFSTINTPFTSPHLSTSVESPEQHIKISTNAPGTIESSFDNVESTEKFNTSPKNKFNKAETSTAPVKLTEKHLNTKTEAMNIIKGILMLDELYELEDDESSSLKHNMSSVSVGRSTSYYSPYHKDCVKNSEQDCGSVDSADIAEEFFKAETERAALPQSQNELTGWWLSSIHLSR